VVTEDQKRRDSLGSWEVVGGTILGVGKRGLRSIRMVGSWEGVLAVEGVCFWGKVRWGLPWSS